MIKVFLLSVVLVLANAAQGQSARAKEQLILYELNQAQGKYLLCRNYMSPNNTSVSEVIIAETFHVESRSGFCSVTMSNVCLLQTKVVNSPAAHETNTVVQNKIIFKVYRMSFPDRTQLIFGGSTTDLSKA